MKVAKKSIASNNSISHGTHGDGSGFSRLMNKADLKKKEEVEQI